MKDYFHAKQCGDSCCLRVQNLSVQIGGDKILKDVNLHVHCGEMVALIGPNGAGKSTFLKTVLGQREYDGVIAFSAPGKRSRKPRIGYVPQSPAFDPSDPISVADLFTCCMGRTPAFLGISSKSREEILESLDMVHGRELIDKCVGTLSGGELQRVLLALALDPMPNILILDEPLSGVDVEGMQSLMDMLDEIRRECDLSILMTTHDFSMLNRYADQVVLIDHVIKAKGTPEEVLSSPAFFEAFRMKGDSL